MSDMSGCVMAEYVGVVVGSCVSLRVMDLTPVKVENVIRRVVPDLWNRCQVEPTPGLVPTADEVIDACVEWWPQVASAHGCVSDTFVAASIRCEAIGLDWSKLQHLVNGQFDREGNLK